MTHGKALFTVERRGKSLGGDDAFHFWINSSWFIHFYDEFKNHFWFSISFDRIDAKNRIALNQGNATRVVGTASEHSELWHYLHATQTLFTFYTFQLAAVHDLASKICCCCYRCRFWLITPDFVFLHWIANMRVVLVQMTTALVYLWLSLKWSVENWDWRGHGAKELPTPLWLIINKEFYW